MGGFPICSVFGFRVVPIANHSAWGFTSYRNTIFSDFDAFPFLELSNFRIFDFFDFCFYANFDFGILRLLLHRFLGSLILEFPNG